MRSLLCIALLALTACGFGESDAQVVIGPDGGAASTSDGGVTAAEQTWLAPQNAARADAQPVPSPPLPALTWAADAAAVAAQYAAGCVYAHNPNRGNRGENIAASAPVGHWGIGDAVAAWAGEIADYDYATNTCAANEDCGHYTQIVWRDTTSVGCAHVTCSTNSPFGAQNPDWDYFVCDYEPPGNYVGQRPY